jgi:hypothetical protein
VLLQAHAALASEQPDWLELASYHLERSALAHPELALLLSAARGVALGDRTKARQVLRLSVMPEEPFEVRRMGIRAWLGVEDALDAWAVSTSRRAAVHSWRGQRAYRAGNYAVSTIEHRRAATLRHGAERAASLLHAAAAVLELHEHTAAEELARAAAHEAREARHAVFEANATWLLRSAQYRRGDPLEVDPDLVENTSVVSVSLGGLSALLEASIAWRSGDTRAADLARSASEKLSGQPAARDLALALAHASGAAVHIDRSRRAPSEITLQICALLQETPDSATLSAITAPPHVRLDVLSVQECLERSDVRDHLHPRS